MLQDPGGGVRPQQFNRANDVGFQSVDPRQLRPTLEPGDLALEVRKEVAMQPYATRHSVGLARSRVAFQPPSRPIDDLMQIFDRGLAKIAALHLFPGRPGLGPLPLLRGRELRRLFELTHVLVEKDTRRSRDLEASLGGLRSQPALQVRRQLDAERT